MRILFITNKNITKKSDFGGAQCAKRNYDLLVSVYGIENIKYIIMSDEEDNSDDGVGITVKIKKSNIAKYFNMLFLRDCFSLSTKKIISNFVKEVDPDVVFFDGSTFGFLGKIIPKYTKKIVFYHNIEKCYAWSRVVNTSLLCLIKYFSYWANEKYITRTADIRICLNERDEKLLQKHYKMVADFILPISFADVVDEHVFTKRMPTGILLFIGSNFMPNVKGITWFCKNVMPYVDKKLIIVGKKMELLRNELETDKIEVIGTVDNLEDYYDRADAMVMPIFIGDGMKVKTAEALMYGKPMFATDEALEGYDVEGINAIYRCNSAKEFVDKINGKITNGYSEEVRKLFIHSYSTEINRDRFEKFLRGNGIG